MKRFLIFLMIVILNLSAFSEDMELTFSGIYQKLEDSKFNSISNNAAQILNRFLDGSDDSIGYSISVPYKKDISFSLSYFEREIDTNLFDNYGINNFTAKYIGDHLKFNQKNLSLQVFKSFKFNKKMSYKIGCGLSHFNTDLNYSRKTSDSDDYYNLKTSNRKLTSCISIGAKYSFNKELSFSIGGVKNFSDSKFDVSPGDFSGDYFTSNTVYANEAKIFNNDGLKYKFGNVSLLMSIDFNFKGL